MQQIYCFSKFERDERATVFFVTEKSEETTFNFSQNAVSII